MKDESALIGQRFGRLVVLAIDPTVRGHRRTHCQCDCGKMSHPSLNNLKRGLQKSCGCLNDENRASGRIHYKHGHARKGRNTSEFTIWQQMRFRCENPSTTHYSNYGGRGIRVCDRWRESFANFLMDMGPRPSSKHSIDRIDVNGHYEPANCRWATAREQGNNTRVNRRLTFQGRTQTLKQWAVERGIDPTTLRQRVVLLGWSTERALTVADGRKQHQRTRTQSTRP